MSLADWSLACAERTLARSAPDRWVRTQAVVQRAREIEEMLGPDGDLLVAGAALHDVGHTPGLVTAGSPGLDAVSHLRREGVPTRLIGLVANCSSRALDARLCGYDLDALSLPDERSALRDALWYCDLTVGGDGKRVAFQERIAEWRRAARNDLIEFLFIDLAYDDCSQAVARTLDRLLAPRLL